MRGPDIKGLWSRFTLSRPADTPAERWLEVSRAALDEVVVYRPGADGGWTTQTLGDQYPWADRAVRVPKSVFVLDVPAGGPTTNYLRVRSPSSLGASLRLWRPAAFAEANATQMALVGGFGLTALVIVLISMEQAWALKDRLHLIYAGYVFHLPGAGGQPGRLCDHRPERRR